MKQTALDSRSQVLRPRRSQQSLAKALTHLMAQHSSGCATFYDPQNVTMGWRVYFENGQIHFAESSVGQQERLTYLLQRYAPQCKLPLSRLSDYNSLCRLLQSQQLTVQQFREFLVHSTQEALSHLLAMPSAQIQFDAQSSVGLPLMAMPLWKVLWPVEPRIAQWSLMQAEIGSAFDRPFIKDWDKFIAFLSDMKGSYCRLSHLTVALKKNLCFYELARRFNMDVEDLAVSIHPLIKVGAVGIHPYQPSPSVACARVACIDSSAAVQTLVQQALEPCGYSVMPITDTTHVFTVLAQQPPSVILLSSHLPQIDGYALCRLLRRIEALQNLPMVMLHESNRLMGGVRNRFCGSTAALPKPIEPLALQTLVHQLLPQDSHHSASSRLTFTYA